MVGSIRVTRFIEIFLFLHHDSLKTARLTPYGVHHASIFVSGLRSEHSNPPRSALAGPGLNRLSGVPEIRPTTLTISPEDVLALC